MLVKIQIKSIFGKVLFELEKENNTIRETLEQAIKENATLYNANLCNANLGGANLGYANLRGAYLCNANLEGAYLYNAYLRGANLRGANLRGANLYNANLRGAYLRGAYLRGAYLRGAYLCNANLEGAYLEDAKNKETATLPIFCKWNFGIKGNLIVIGCKEKTIEQWDLWFDSEEEYSTSRDTEDFKQIQAIYNALKSYYLTLNK